MSLYLFPAGEDFSKMQAYQRWNPGRGLMDEYFPYSSTMALTNPYWITENIEMPNKKNRYTASAQFRYDFTDWLNVTARVKSTAPMNRANANMTPAPTPSTRQVRFLLQGRLSPTSRYTASSLYQSTKYLFDRNLNLMVNAGANFENTDYQNDYFGGQLKTVANLFTFANVDFAGRDLARQDGFHLKKRAVFGTMQLGYQSKVYLDLSARNDWSSTFKGTSTSSFFYPSVGLSGIVTDILGMQSRILNFAKVRVSYSEVGNAPEVFIAIPPYEIKDGAVTTVTRRPNSNLKPERTKAWEAGLNLAMFDSKFRLDATFYYSRALSTSSSSASARSSTGYIRDFQRRPRRQQGYRAFGTLLQHMGRSLLDHLLQLLD